MKLPGWNVCFASACTCPESFWKRQGNFSEGFLGEAAAYKGMKPPIRRPL